MHGSNSTIAFDIPHTTALPTQVEENHNTTETNKNENKFKGLLYSKQHLTKKKREGTISEHDQAPPQRLDPEVGDNTSIIPGKPISIDELDLHIFLRKNARSCTTHALSNFVSYNNLSPSFDVFVTQMFSVVIPNNVHEALKVLEW